MAKQLDPSVAVYNIRARQHEQDLVRINEAFGEGSEGDFFEYTDRQLGSAKVPAHV